VKILSQFQTREDGRFPSREIVEAASDRLRNSPYVRNDTVSCECNRGVLRLSGQLPTFYQKQLAQEAVKDLERVAQIVNDIEVVG
jgi:osmotically-inducible protein OsmY